MLQPIEKENKITLIKLLSRIFKDVKLDDIVTDRYLISKCGRVIDSLVQLDLIDYTQFLVLLGAITGILNRTEIIKNTVILNDFITHNIN